MGCTRNRSKIWDNCLLFLVLSGFSLVPSPLWAAFASQFSLGVGETYSDNIFFSKDREHDFVSLVRPTLTLLYAPPGQVVPTLNLSLTTRGEVYARHSDLNNFGDNVLANAGYTYQYSPRLSFNFFDTFQRQGPTRLGGYAFGAFPTGPTSPLPPGGVPPGSSSQNLSDLISAGDQLSNYVGFQGSFLYRPDISFMAGYYNSFTKFIDAGGTDV